MVDCFAADGKVWLHHDIFKDVECSCSTPGCSLSRNIKQLRYLRDVTFTITTNEQMLFLLYVLETTVTKIKHKTVLNKSK